MYLSNLSFENILSKEDDLRDKLYWLQDDLNRPRIRSDFISDIVDQVTNNTDERALRNPIKFEKKIQSYAKKRMRELQGNPQWNEKQTHWVDASEEAILLIRTWFFENKLTYQEEPDPDEGKPIETLHIRL